MVDEAKSHTQVAQLTTAAVVAIVLLFLTKPLQYLPNAVLSAVVFLIGLKLVDVANMREIWRLRRDEFWVAATTAAVVVVRRRRAGHHPRDRALADPARQAPLRSRATRVVGWDARDGSACSRPVPGAVVRARPRHLPLRRRPLLRERRAARPTRSSALVDVPDPPRWFVLDADAIDDVDYTGGKTLAELAEQLADRGIVFAVAGATPRSASELDRFGVTAKIGPEHVFDDRRRRPRRLPRRPRNVVPRTPVAPGAGMSTSAPIA